MRAPAVTIDSAVTAEVDGQVLVGRVVGVFQDGQRACAHFRCFRCDYAGKPRDGITEELALEPGYVYLVAHRDSSREYVVREADLLGGVNRSGGGVVAVPAVPTDEQVPTDRQVVLLATIAALSPPTLESLRVAVGARSVPHVDDMVARLERKGLAERRVEDGRQVVSLTERGARWASGRR